MLMWQSLWKFLKMKEILLTDLVKIYFIEIFLSAILEVCQNTKNSTIHKINYLKDIC